MIREGGEPNGTSSEADLITGLKGDGSKVQLMIQPTIDRAGTAVGVAMWMAGANGLERVIPMIQYKAPIYSD